MSIRRILTILATVLVAAACEPDEYQTYMVSPSGNETKAMISLDVVDPDAETKSTLGSDVESKDSGYQLLVFFHDTGKLEGVYKIASRTAPDLKVAVTAGRKLDFFVVGNLWFIDKVTGEKKGYDDLLASAFPTEESSLSDVLKFPAYRFDGKTVGSSSFRTETFAEAATYGLPYAGSKTEGIAVSDGSSVTIEVKYLFARVDITVDHTGIDGGVVDNFRNGKLYLRQANCRVHPFVDLKAEEAADILEESDYEATMANDRSLTFTLYVPENRQTGLGFSNSAPNGKTPQSLATQGLSSIAPYLTYVEYTANANAAAGGYGGDFTYRFYLGGNTTDNFDIQRGMKYNVTLGFNAASLFDPYWKMDGTVSDTRKIYFSQDAAGTLPLASGQTVALRENRDAVFYLYFNRSGNAGSNEAASYLEEWHDGYTPSDMTHSAYRYSFSGDVAASGITPSYDSTTGKLTMKVTNPALFTAGKTFDLTLTMYPGGETHTVTVKTFENLSATMPDINNWFVAMKRHLSVSGFAGSSINVTVEQGGDCLKTTNVYSDAFIGSSTVNAPIFGLDFFAYKSVSGGKINITTDDPFNDGEFSFNFDIQDPVLQIYQIADNIDFTVRGDEKEVIYGYKPNAEAGTPTLNRNGFDDAVWSQTLMLVPEKGDGISSAAFGAFGFSASEKAGITGDHFYAYLNSPQTLQDALGFRYGGRKFYESRTMSDTITNFVKFVSKDGKHSTDLISGTIHNIWKGGIAGVWYDSNGNGEIDEGETVTMVHDFGSVPFAAMHDYSTLNQTVLPTYLQDERKKEFSSMQLWFGVDDPDDLIIDIVPQSSNSPANKSLKGSFVNTHNFTRHLMFGSIHLEFNDDDTMHSYGKHKVFASVENKHSHEKISQYMGEIDIHFYVGLAADFYIAGMDGDELEIDFGGVLVCNEHNLPALIDSYLTNNNIKVGFDGMVSGPVDSSMLPGMQGGYSSATIRAVNQVTRPVWASDHLTDGDFNLWGPYMRMYVSGNDYLIQEYQNNRDLVMDHFFPRVKIIDEDSHAVSELTLSKLNGNTDVDTDGYIHLITSNFYDPTNYVRGWLNKVWVH